MVLAMSRPQRHPKTGVYRSRKAVPQELRGIVGKRELIESLGTKDPKVALERHPAVLARFDAILAAARDQLAGRTRSLSAREIDAMAGEVYRQAVADAEREPGRPEDRELALDFLRDEGPQKEADDETWPPFRPSKQRLAKAEAFLRERGIHADGATIAAMAESLWHAEAQAADVAVRFANRDWSPDPNAARFPMPTPQAPVVIAPPDPSPLPTAPPATAAPALTTAALLAEFAKINEQLPKTLGKREAAMKHLVAAAGHDDAARIGKADVRAMRDARLAKVKPATVIAEFAVLRPLWRWGMSNGLLPDGVNPFADMNPGAKKSDASSRDYFTGEEVATILRAARGEAGWLRWVPWVLAFTGARLGEICDAAADDVREESGVWCLAIHAEKRTVKTRQSLRLVPLANALIAEGFVRYARAQPRGGPLFPDLAVGAYGKRSSIATKTLGRRLRALGIKDAHKVAGHSWRHRMIDLLRRARVRPDVADAIVGHVNASNAGSGYGRGFRAWPDETKKELEKAALVPPGLMVPSSVI